MTPLLTLAEAAAHLGISRRSVQRATDLPRIRIGRAVRFEQSDLNDWKAKMAQAHLDNYGSTVRAGRVRVGAVRPFTDSDGRIRFSARIRLQDGTTRQIRCPMGLSRQEAKNLTAEWQAREDATGGLLLAKQNDDWKHVVVAPHLKPIPDITSGGVYYVMTGSIFCPAIKIGHATNVRSRMKSLRCSSPWPLDLVAIEPHATKAVERERHKRFGADRMTFTGAGTEWFRLSRPLVEHIENLRSINV